MTHRSDPHPGDPHPGDPHPGGRGPGAGHATGRDATDAATGLDLLLATAGPPRSLLPVGPALRMAAALAARPLAVARRGTGLAVELLRIGAGRSGVTPDPRDGRWTDPAWSRDPLLRRLVQAHLTASAAAADLVSDAELGWADHERLRTAVTAVAHALAPSNSPLHPAAVRAARDSRGASLVRGARHLLADLATPPRVPSFVEPDAFVVGRDVAATPGAVVLRTPVAELIQYLPQTEAVRAVPLLVVPPLTNRYYLADLAPGRSIVEHLVRGGQQVFVLSWRNPTAEHAARGLDAYGRAVLDAMDACGRITRTSTTSLMGLLSGGLLTAAVLAHLAAVGARERVGAVTFAATVLDHDLPGALHDPDAAHRAVARSARTGHLDGRDLVEVLAWRRAEDLVWPRWVDGYLCGNPPAAHDLLHWTADTARIPAALHRDLAAVVVDNALVRPGAATLLGTPVDLSKIDQDAYVVAGADDLLVPWRVCYRTTRLLGGRSRFVLAAGGHVRALVPPRHDRAFRVGEPAPEDPARWLATAVPGEGCWWSDHLAWLGARSGPLVDAPPELGGRGLHAVAPAPGDYVLAR